MDLDGVVVDGGFRLHAEELAAGGLDRTPVVLLHGFGASSATWQPMADRLGALGRRVVAFDRLGFGRSDRPRAGAWPARSPSPYRPSAASGHTVALLDALGIERAVLVGHSAGCVGATLVALDAPDRVESLGLLAPAVLTDGPPRLVASAFSLPGAAAVAPWVLRRSVGFLGRGLRSAWHDPRRVTGDDLERYLAPLRTPGWEHALVELTKAVEPLRLGDRLGAIAAPALVVAGEHDRFVKARDARRVTELLGGPADLVVVPDAGHLVHEEQPAAVADALEGWLSRTA